jgi:hypothetical protein
MKVVLDKQEIQEAVQCYVNIVLGSSLNVTDLTVIQGRESNGARIELELSKYLPPIDLDDIDVVASPVQVQEAEPEKPKQEIAIEKGVTSEEVPATPKKTRQAVAALNTPVEDDDEEEQIPMDNSPVTEPNPVPTDAVAPKSASVMTSGMSPLPGSFFSNN